MSSHPLHSLGFKAVASLADLGFEPQLAGLTKVERIDSKNGVAKGLVRKGSLVRLMDGTVARVRYADPKMRIVRVRTQDGRKLTVRHKDLRGDVGP
jgi:hypothetical protein